VCGANKRTWAFTELQRGFRTRTRTPNAQQRGAAIKPASFGLYITLWPLHARGAALACSPSLLPFTFFFDPPSSYVQSTYIRLYRYCGNLAHAAMYLRRARVVGRGSTAGAWGDDGKKPRRGPLVALPGEGVWRHAWGDGAHCPSTARHAAFNYQKNTRPKLGYLDWI
jgi:hypothetical protein